MTGGHWRIFLAGAGALIVVIAGAIGAGAVFGSYNVAADGPRSPLIAHFVQFVRERSVDVRASGIKAPRLDRPMMIADGASDYDEMCASCHLAPGLPENEMRPGLNPKPPLLARSKRGDPSEQFWIIKHGIEMTAMPAWGRTHSDEEIWNIVAFLQVLPGLSPQSYRALVAKAAGHHHSDEASHMKM